MTVLDEPRMDNPNNLIIGMHLFFEKELDEKYRQSIDDKLKNYQGPIIIMDDAFTMEYLRRYVKQMNPGGERYFIKTKPCSNALLSMKFDDFVSFLRCFSNYIPISLMGGYYNRESNRITGCLGSLDSELIKFGFETELVQGCVFQQ